MGPTPTVGDLRNDIRLEIGRFERRDSPPFTKEDLAAICEAAGYEIDTNHLPPKADMRAGISRNLDIMEADTPAGVDRPYRKAELESIHTALESM